MPHVRYEYRIIDTRQEGCPLGGNPDDAWPRRLEEGLNAIGRDGWLLVSVRDFHLFFARPVLPGPPTARRSE